MKTIHMTTAELITDSSALCAGDRILLSGTLYTARDAAHKRYVSEHMSGNPPFDVRDKIFYYAGPTPAPREMETGSCGPTTSGRMNPYAPYLLDLGLGGMIGKGPMSEEVRDKLIKHRRVYLCAVGGAGALYAEKIKSCREFCYFDLKTESVKELLVEGFPVYVGIDIRGKTIFDSGKMQSFQPIK